MNTARTIKLLQDKGARVSRWRDLVGTGCTVTVNEIHYALVNASSAPKIEIHTEFGLRENLFNTLK